MWIVLPFITLWATVVPTADRIASTHLPDTRECYDNTFCIESVSKDGRVELFVSKLVAWDFTLVVDMQLENMTPDRQLPLVKSFVARGPEPLMKLNVKEPNRRWSYKFNLRWVVGAMEARHDDSFIYSLPFARNDAYLVAQGFNGDATHHGKNAIDFDMPKGTGVRAARGGTVIELKESFYRGGLDPSLMTQANYVKIRHEDGTIGHYVHLMQNGVRVYVGDRIRSGDLIGYSGHTGYSSGPHLHFEVYTISRDLQPETIPVRFRANGRNAILLEAGTVYRH